MRKLLAAAIAATLAAGIAVATGASASTAAAPTQQFTCAHFQDPTVELVWSHVCRF